MILHFLLEVNGCLRQEICVIIVLVILMATPLAHAQATDSEPASSLKFLVSERGSGSGILYTATAGKLRGRLLPLSFADSPEYWGEYVCRLPGNTCTVVDVYDPQTSSLTPEKSIAGDLQTERGNAHNGSNIYDAATWQIAIMLGHVVNRFSPTGGLQPYTLISNQNDLLQEGHNGKSSRMGRSEVRAITVGEVFVYNQQTVTDPRQAYAFRMLPGNWLSVDPFSDTKYGGLIKTRGLPNDNPAYRSGLLTWTDWKPISGENSWAFLIGPLQAAYLNYVVDQKRAFVPLQDTAVQSALTLLPTFALMQSPSGGIYYAPTGTVANQGDQLVNPYGVSVENTISLYAGLTILRSTLRAIGTHAQNLSGQDKNAINQGLQVIEVMINGGILEKNRKTSGLLSFFAKLAWQGGEFVQGGSADDPAQTEKWLPRRSPKAVDVNTWGIAALGPQLIDRWFGFGAAYRNWQQVKQWGAYGRGKTLWGVGFSDQDGNGIDADGNYRQGILSTEWTAGAITMVRSMIDYYQRTLDDSANASPARHMVENLKMEEESMLTAIANMRLDKYISAAFPGRPQNMSQLLPSMQTKPYVYASKRYLIPFGWYANPLPSTCATAWMIMVHDGYNPFVYGGKY